MMISDYLRSICVPAHAHVVLLLYLMTDAGGNESELCLSLYSVHCSSCITRQAFEPDISSEDTH